MKFARSEAGAASLNSCGGEYCAGQQIYFFRIAIWNCQKVYWDERLAASKFAFCGTDG
jgi:hypothetical protein